MFKLLNQTKLKPWQHTTATSKYDVLQTPTTVFNPKLNHVKKEFRKAYLHCTSQDGIGQILLFHSRVTKADFCGHKSGVE